MMQIFLFFFFIETSFTDDTHARSLYKATRQLDILIQVQPFIRLCQKQTHCSYLQITVSNGIRNRIAGWVTDTVWHLQEKAVLNWKCVKHVSIARILSVCFLDEHKFLKVVALGQCFKKKELNNVLFLKWKKLHDQCRNNCGDYCSSETACLHDIANIALHKYSKWEQKNAKGHTTEK